MFERELHSMLINKLVEGHHVLLQGSRYLGKTDLVKKVSEDADYILNISDSEGVRLTRGVLYLDGDNSDFNTFLNGTNRRNSNRMISPGMIRWIVRSHQFVIIDEAQRLENIGKLLRLIADSCKGVQLIITSSLPLGNNEKDNTNSPSIQVWASRIYPINWNEYILSLFEENDGNPVEDVTHELNERICYGFYPAVCNEHGNSTGEEHFLKIITEQHLTKELSVKFGVHRPDIIKKILITLALSICDEINYSSLARKIAADKKTVNRYINMLEEAQIIFRIGSLHKSILPSQHMKNPASLHEKSSESQPMKIPASQYERSPALTHNEHPASHHKKNPEEICNREKVYFFDTGIRNTFLEDYRKPDTRPDGEALWANFVIVERIKTQHYRRIFVNRYFWRTSNKEKVAFIEEKDGILNAFQFTLDPSRVVHFPKAFLRSYRATTHIIHPGNFEKFIKYELAGYEENLTP